MRLTEDYIKNKQNKRDGNIYNIYDDVNIYILSELPEFVNIGHVANFLKSNIPTHFFHNVDGIYITEIPEFKARDINAIYKDGAIYITGHQDSEDDLLDDIIHELAHALEHTFSDLIYSDASLKREFLNKRIAFWDIIQEKDKSLYSDFISPHYSKRLDDFFYRELGYDYIEEVCPQMFVTPYAITSLREYWATGVEFYMLHGKKEVKLRCPALFTKIEQVLRSEYE